MKAKEYAAIFMKDYPYENNDVIDQIISKIAISFMLEMGKLCEARHSVSDSTVISVAKEQCQKWNTFARIVNKEIQDIHNLDEDETFIKEDGFEQLLYKRIPQIKGLIK